MELPSDEDLQWIVRSYARLRSACAEAIEAPPLVLPTAEFFPDDFHNDAPSVGRFLKRMIACSPVSDDLPLQLAFVQDDATDGQRGGCGSLGCETGPKLALRAGVDASDDGYRVTVRVADVSQAEVLAASLARAVGALVILEGGLCPGEALPSPEDSELAAVASGFGVLVANGAAVWGKSCSGLRMVQATQLPVEAIGVALSLFVAVCGGDASRVRAHLGLTQREALEHADAWVESNALMVDTLRSEPTSLLRGPISFEPTRGLLGRWLHKRRMDRVLRPAAVKVAPVSEEKRRRLQEARDLVDEVFSDSSRGGWRA